MKCTGVFRPLAVFAAWAVAWAATCAAADAPAAKSPPIALHPDNPHYLQFRTRPTVLVTSTEHYGSVLNLDFNSLPYLDEIKRRGLNLTRTFSGVYCEDPQSFGIRGNPLAPAPGRLICPWARSTVPGYANGGNKFDLNRWDEAYFARLKDFVAQAGKRGIVVELALFCPFYEDAMWKLSPMNAANNVNAMGSVPRTEVYTTKHADLLALHEAVTRKIVAELKDYDNLYYEVCNEPYFGGVTGAWQERIIAAIMEAESGLAQKHLIAQNIANGSQKIGRPNPAVSIFNFHYATPPAAVAVNWGLGRAIADDETGFKGSADFVYRAEGWDFLMAGGAIYDNLDYSFTPAQSDGSAVPHAPGGGGAVLRGQLRIAKEFLESFDFIKMAPKPAVIGSKMPPRVTARCLAEPGRQYAVYVRGDGLSELTLDLPEGRYRAEWVSTKTGALENVEPLDHTGCPRALQVPRYQEDIALRVKRL